MGLHIPKNWYEKYLESEERQFFRDLAFSGMTGCPTAMQWAIVAIYQHERLETLKELGYDDPYRQ